MKSDILDLSSLYFGKDDAESDAAPGGLLRDSFLETSAFEQAQRGNKRLMIGRKGAGKSAICVRLLQTRGATLSTCLIAPDEVSADELRRFSLQGVSGEQSKTAIWRYVIAVQVAKFVVAHGLHGFKKEPRELKQLRQFLRDNGESEDSSFRERFYQIAQRIKTSVSVEAFGIKLAAGLNAAPSEGTRFDQVIESIENHIRKTIEVVGCAAAHEPLLLVIDQLENIWSNDRASDDTITGLLLAVKRATSASETGGLPHLRCIVFIRTDIYDLLHFDEGDKFRGDEWRIDWNAQRLLEVAVLRAQASLGSGLDPGTLWNDVFPAVVSGLPIQAYIVNHTLMRPRDLIQLCNLCRDTAEKNGNPRITERDVLEATEQYSNWKLQDLAAEWRVNYPYLFDLFVLFQNSSYIVTRRVLGEKLAAISRALQARYPQFAEVFQADLILEVLFAIGFIGVLREGRTGFSYEQSQRLSFDDDKFVVHPAFREALRATEGIDVVPRDVLSAFRSMSSIGANLTRSNVAPRTRGSLEYRLAHELTYMCDQVRRASSQTKLPSETVGEIHAGLRHVESLSARIMGGEDSPRPVLLVCHSYFREMAWRLESTAVSDEFATQALIGTLRQVSNQAKHLASGSSTGQYL